VTDDSFNSLDGGGLFPRLQQRYGLRDNPLEMETPFFPEGMRHHALEALRHLCGFGDMALLLTGAPGSGKSRLLAELVRSESSRLGFHRLPAAAMTSSNALARDLKQVARSGANPDDNPRETVYRFFRWSESRVVKGQRMVLLIDDADRVSPELLRLILDGFLAADRAKAAVPVFAGEDRLVTLLGLGDSSVSIHQVHLRPLTREEVFSYLEPRVHKAGGKVNELLSPARLARIHDLSQGSFSRLKRVTPGIWLDIVSDASKPKRSRGINFKQLRLPALALLLLGGSWWFVSQQYNETVALEQENVPEPDRLRKSITIGPDTPEAESPDEAPQPLTEPASPPEPVSEPVSEPDFVPKNASRYVDIEQLRNRSKAWTIQLVAGNLEQTALSVIARYPDLEMVYTVGARKSEPWFMVLYGSYSSKAEAQKVVSGLPDALILGVPWVRTTKDL